MKTCEEWFFGVVFLFHFPPLQREKSVKSVHQQYHPMGVVFVVVVSRTYVLREVTMDGPTGVDAISFVIVTDDRMTIDKI
jgi:hypothetical protein